MTDRAITVGELRKAIDRLPDDAPIVITAMTMETQYLHSASAHSAYGSTKPFLELNIFEYVKEDYARRED
jgi:hypothetical protein